MVPGCDRRIRNRRPSLGGARLARWSHELAVLWIGAELKAAAIFFLDAGEVVAEKLGPVDGRSFWTRAWLHSSSASFEFQYLM